MKSSLNSHMNTKQRHSFQGLQIRLQDWLLESVNCLGSLQFTLEVKSDPNKIAEYIFYTHWVYKDQATFLKYILFFYSLKKMFCGCWSMVILLQYFLFFVPWLYFRNCGNDVLLLSQKPVCHWDTVLLLTLRSSRLWNVRAQHPGVPHINSIKICISTQTKQ